VSLGVPWQCRILRRGERALAAYLWSGRSVVRLAWAGLGFRWPLFRDILRVGVVAALVTVQTNLTIAIATGLVGRFGPAAIAGYGTGSRVEYLLIPLVFGWAVLSFAMVGTNIGAGQRHRAVRAAGSAPPSRRPHRLMASRRRRPRAPGSRCSIPISPCSTPARAICMRSVRSTAVRAGMALYFRRRAPGGCLAAAGEPDALGDCGGWRLAGARWSGDLSQVFLALGAALARFGLINAERWPPGAWFGPLAGRARGAYTKRYRAMMSAISKILPWANVRSGAAGRCGADHHFCRRLRSTALSISMRQRR